MRKVLIVDDSETIRLDVRRTLGAAGFSVLEARDGLDGLTVAAAHPDLSLLILDVNMPVMNGLEMLERLRQDPTTADIPVLLMTTEASRFLTDGGDSIWVLNQGDAAGMPSEMVRIATERLAR